MYGPAAGGNGWPADYRDSGEGLCRVYFDLQQGSDMNYAILDTGDCPWADALNGKKPFV